MIKVRNKHALLELLQAGVSFERVTVVQNLEQDMLTKRILSEAHRAGIPVEELPYRKMSPSRSGEVHEVIVGYLAQQKTFRLDEQLACLDQKGEIPFLLLMNKVKLPNNIGSISRTAYAAGVNGLIFQGAKDEFFNEETVHYSLGTIARIAHVKSDLKEAVKLLSDRGITTAALDMDGVPYFQEDLHGPAAFILGAEREGLPEPILQLCDKRISIPMRLGIDSLNVSNSAAIILYEKVRQESIGL